MDYAKLAAETVGFLKPYIIAAGGKLAKDSLHAAREKVFGWLKSKFTKPVQTAALEEALQSPQDAGAFESLQLQIRLALEKQEDFRKELLELLPKEIVQTADVTGNANVTIQTTGSGNINIQR